MSRKTKKNEDTDRVRMEWTLHKAQAQPLRTAVILCIIALAGLSGWLLFHSLLLVLMGMFFIFTSVSEFLLPIHYQLSQQKVSAAWGWTKMEMEWNQVKQVFHSSNGVRLSPLTNQGRLNAFRGVQLCFTKDKEKEVLRLIANLAPEAVHIGETKEISADV
jgi:hypothetical protein